MNGQLALECILIADDLTGACDTGVQFARHGFSSEVWVDPSHAVNQAAEVVAFNTGSRGDEITAARVKIRRIADLCSDIKPRILFKKIDSTLRGNVGQVPNLPGRDREAERFVPAPLNIELVLRSFCSPPGSARRS